jgi:O-antigen/teichoic acid export membrane protein
MKWITHFLYSLRLERGLIFVTIGNVVSICLGSVLWFLLASLSSTHSYGSINYYISVATISGSIGIMGFDITLTTFTAKGLTKMVTESGSLVLISGIVISFALSLIFMSLSLIISFIGLMFFIFSVAEILGSHLYKEFMIVMILARAISLVSVPILFRAYGVDGALYAYGLSYLPVSYRFFISLRKFNLSLSTLRPIKAFFFHSYAVGIFKTLVVCSDKLVIMPLFGPAILGYYQFGFQILTTASIIPIIITHYLLPQEAANKNINGKRLQILSIFSSTLITIVMISIIPTIINDVFPSFKIAVLPVQIILLAGIPLTLIAVFNSLLMARVKSFHVFVASGIFLVMQYLLIATLGALYGLIGLSISTVIASIAQTVYLFIIKRKLIPTSKNV